MDLLARLEAAFPPADAPEASSLVVFDGFDHPAKESAMLAFGGKTRSEVGAMVGGGPSGVEALWGIEDLEVLEPPALRYYLPPFLRHLVAQELEEPADFSFFLAYSVSEILKRRGSGLLSASQRAVLAAIATEFQKRLPAATDEYSAAHRGHYAAILERLQRGGP